MKKERFLSFIEDRRSSREFGGSEISEGEREDLINMATPPPCRLRSSRKGT